MAWKGYLKEIPEIPGHYIIIFYLFDEIKVTTNEYIAPFSSQYGSNFNVISIQA